MLEPDVGTVPPGIAAALEPFGIRGGAISPILEGQSNSSYLIDRAFVLTLLDHHDRASAHRLAETTRYVLRQGVLTSEPTVSRLGEVVGIFDNTPFLVKTYLRGLPVSRVRRPDYRALGRLLAQVHRIPPPPDAPAEVRRLPSPEELASADLPADLDLAIRQIADHAPSMRRSGREVFVHGDLFLDNVILDDDGRFALLDWETAGVGPPVLDICIALLGIAFQRPSDYRHAEAAFLAGYAEQSAWRDWDVEVLDTAFDYAAVTLALRRFLMARKPRRIGRTAPCYRELLRLAGTRRS